MHSQLPKFDRFVVLTKGNLKEWNQPNVTVIPNPIGFQSEQSAELEKLIRDKNLQTHFFLLGADPNPYPYMKHCDIFVQTSRFEGLGLTVIEAALLCKPIVSTNFPTVFGIIENEETGLIAEMEPVDIAEKIERIIQDVELKKRLIENLSRRENNDKTESLEKINSLFNTPSH